MFDSGSVSLGRCFVVYLSQGHSLFVRTRTLLLKYVFTYAAVFTNAVCRASLNSNCCCAGDKRHSSVPESPHAHGIKAGRDAHFHQQQPDPKSELGPDPPHGSGTLLLLGNACSCCCSQFVFMWKLCHAASRHAATL